MNISTLRIDVVVTFSNGTLLEYEGSINLETEHHMLSVIYINKTISSINITQMIHKSEYLSFKLLTEAFSE